MKIKLRNNSLPKRTGFTLIELLVVIVIIGVLASLVISQANKLMADGRKLQVQTVLKDLRVAIQSYQVDYNRYPVNPSLLSAASSGQDIQAIPTDENSGIVSALTSVSASGSGGGATGGATNMNPKDIKFIDLPIAKNGKFGLVNPQPPYKLVDLWGTPYYVLLDTNGDKQVINPDLNNADPKIAQNTISPPPKMLPLEIAIYSWGQDLQAQTADDVTSWRTK